MSDAFAFLGLRPDADVRAIKRAYALRLRDARPDSDASAFQQTHEAYRAALSWAQRRDAERLAQDASAPDLPRPAPAPNEGDRDVASAVAQPPDLAEPAHSDAPVADPSLIAQDADDAAGQTAIRFDFAGFLRDLYTQAAAGDASALTTWLRSQPVLYSLDAKAAIGAGVITALQTEQPPMREASFDAILKFFGFDHVLAMHDPLRVNALRSRLNLQWLFEPRQRDEFAALLVRQNPSIAVPPERVLANFRRPFSWRGAIWPVLRPRLPRALAQFTALLDHSRFDAPPRGFDRRQILFWRLAGDPTRVSFQRLFVGGVRCAAFTLGALAYDGLAAALRGYADWMMTELSLIVAALWLAYISVVLVTRWQVAPQNADRARDSAWLRLGFIPAACAAAVALHGAAWLPTAPAFEMTFCAGALILLALVIAVVRYRVRAHLARIAWAGNLSGWRLIFIVPVLRVLPAVFVEFTYLIECGAVVAMGIWIADLWKQRAYLRASLLRS